MYIIVVFSPSLYVGAGDIRNYTIRGGKYLIESYRWHIWYRVTDLK